VIAKANAKTLLEAYNKVNTAEYLKKVADKTVTDAEKKVVDDAKIAYDNAEAEV